MEVRKKLLNHYNINRLNMIKRIALTFIFIAIPSLAFADISIHLDVEGTGGALYDNTISVAPCPVTTDIATTTVSAKCALEQAGLTPQWSPSGDDFFLTEVGGVSQDAAKNLFWDWWQDLSFGQVALNKHELHDGENLLVTLSIFPLKISASTDLVVGATTTVSVQEFGFDSAFNPIWNPSPGATVHFGNMSSTTDATAVVGFIPASTVPVSVFAEKNGFVKSAATAVTPRNQYVTLTIRANSGTAFSGAVDLPVADAPDVAITPTGTTTSILVPARSVLAILSSLDATSTAFDVTDLSYSKGFNSFLINCIAIPSGSATPDCFSWTDAVDGVYPQVGVDHQILKDGDVIYLFFGPQHKVFLSKSSVVAGEHFTAEAQQYDLPTGTYVPLPAVTIGVGTPKPDFTFTELATSTSDTSGRANFTLSATGTYQVGIKEDFYFPTTRITISEAPQTPPVVVGGGGSGGISHTPLNGSLALSYLSAQQKTDGSYGSSLYSDWAAIAFSAADPGAAKTKLANYMQTNTSQLSSVTDYERHAMALEAFGINPYNGTSIDYIAHIVSAFDGTQIGDVSFDNDDIFALYPFMHAGYSPSDDIIKKTAAFILSKQRPDGSWDGSVDMTAAALQALGPLFADRSLAQKLGPSFGKAVGYLAANQQSNGGWGNVDSTSWVQTMINSVNESDPAHASNWASPVGYLPNDAIGSQQQSDGGLKPVSETTDNRVWSTAYAVVAASGKSWQSALHTFSKPTTASSGTVFSGGGNPYATSTVSATTTATSTPSVATSTPLIIPEVLGTSTVATSTVETATTTSPMNAKRVTIKPARASGQGPGKQKKTAVNHVSRPITGEQKSTQQESKAGPLSQTAAVQNAGGFFSRFWSAVNSWLGKIF